MLPSSKVMGKNSARQIHGAQLLYDTSDESKTFPLPSSQITLFIQKEFHTA